MFRILGLEAGKYWVRSGAYTLVDGNGRLPAFGLSVREIQETRVHQITLDADTAEARISPETAVPHQQNNHLRYGRSAHCDLSSETGRRRMQNECPPLTYQTGYPFEGLAPAVYEVLATLQDGVAPGFTELYFDHDTNSMNLQFAQAPTVECEVRRAGSKRRLRYSSPAVGPPPGPRGNGNRTGNRAAANGSIESYEPITSHKAPAGLRTPVATSPAGQCQRARAKFIRFRC